MKSEMPNLDEPGEEEDERTEVEEGPPRGQAVDGAVHEERPALLGRSLVHGEHTGRCK